MFTLKITEALRVSNGPPVTWLADVSEVSRIRSGKMVEIRKITGPDAEGNILYPCTGYADLAGDADEVALLYVTRRAGSQWIAEYMVVEWAWLLGPDGQTIERIAP